MNILLVSQCHKNALKETRRILDQFAERCGDRVWQTPITQAGLKTLRNLLRQTARKNTAVACYWTHGKNHTELLWVVGDQSQFNAHGRVPTNRTQRDILRTQDETPWIHGYSIQLLAALGALFHDLGKASLAFQAKLRSQASCGADPYRHEWVSVRLFEAMIDGCETDQQWLSRLANWAEYEAQQPNWLARLKQEKATPNEDGFRHLPPLAQSLIWLIASHHRTAYLNIFSQTPTAYKRHWHSMSHTLRSFYAKLSASPQWVANPNSAHPHPTQFWQFAQLASQSQSWQKAVQRWANKALNHKPLMALSATNQLIADPFLLLLARVSLITADHYYSALNGNPHLGEPNFPLIANTDRTTHQAKQRLDEHLLGVCQSAARFAHILPKLKRELPALAKHRPFKKRTTATRFHWQNHAFDLAKSLQAQTEQHGFFGVNMASTGYGKTLGNARIMSALSPPERGSRFTIALGLRVLTLQTGKALQTKLDLDEDALTVLVGSSAIRQLFEQQHAHGSESAQAWLDELQVEGGIVSENALEHLPEFSTLLAEAKARTLLQTPLVVCTIDHLIQASEGLRGGKHIVPILRLLTADLILDEPDDFEPQDLPALSRLVHLAGLFGAKVLLSSATLTPDLIQGLFEAYQAGRQIWAHNNQLADLPVCCAWFDEFHQQAEQCQNNAQLCKNHLEFTRLRIAKLQTQAPQRIAHILTLPSLSGIENQALNWSVLAAALLQQAQHFHRTFAECDPLTQKHVSLGLIRFANIQPMIPTLQAMLQQQVAEDTQVHLCCYHSHQLLVLRNRLEQRLDRILNRHDPQALFADPDIMRHLRTSPFRQHIFIVVGSPVTEVGRDHDYDWAIVDPSSMRSIIQLAGRVWRHRPHKTATQPNIALLPSNWRGLQADHYFDDKKAIIFQQPGFESEQCYLKNHATAKIIPAEQLNPINAIARIAKPANLNSAAEYQNTLSELEHTVMENLFNQTDINYINGYWRTESGRLTAHYALSSPFRQRRPTEDFICLPNENASNLTFYLAETILQNPQNSENENHRFVHQALPPAQSQIQPWLVTELGEALQQLAQELDCEADTALALRYATVTLPQMQQTKWHFNEFFGFWRPESE